MTVHHRLDHGQTQPQAVAALSRGKTPILTESAATTDAVAVNTASRLDWASSIVACTAVSLAANAVFAVLLGKAVTKVDAVS